MNRNFTIIIGLVIVVFTSCDQLNLQPKQVKTYYGVQEDAKGITLRTIDINSNTAASIAKINDMTPLKKGVFSYDTRRDYFILGTESGVVVIDVRTNDIVNTFDGISEIEYDKNADRLCGLTWDSEEQRWYFSHANHVNGTVERVKQLNSFWKVVSGSATFDFNRNRYIFNSDRGLYVLDATTGEQLLTLQGVTNTEFNEATGMLIGLKTNNLKSIVEIDPDTPIITELAKLNDVGGVMLGASSFDSASGNYIIETNYGVTVVKYKTGQVVSTFSDIMQLAVLDKVIPEIEKGNAY